MGSYSRLRPGMSRLDPFRASAICISLWTCGPRRAPGQGEGTSPAYSGGAPLRVVVFRLACLGGLAARASVETIHRHAEPLGDDAGDRVGPAREELARPGARDPVEPPHHRAGGGAAPGGAADPHPHAVEVWAAPLGQDGANAVIAAVTAAGAQLQTAARQIQVVVHADRLHRFDQ